jgi:thiamine-phosphate pyrophosphorylase
MSRLPFPPLGLYAITREGYPDAAALAEAVAAAIRGGAAVVQYRAKSAADPVAEAERLLAVCRAGGVPLVINDDVELAGRIGADGVHLGKDDPDLEEARRILGPDAIIGVSCYDSVERAVQAEAAGAGYVAFGRFFPSRTKPGAPCARLETLVEAKRRLSVPIVAIGGITPENGGPLLEAGAGLLAVIDGVFGAGDPERAARRFAPLFAPAP